MAKYKIAINMKEMAMKAICEDILKKSFEEMLTDDYHLLENNVHEISISSILARYIQQYIDKNERFNSNNINVDIEYNRMVGKNSKQIDKSFNIEEQVSKAIYAIKYDNIKSRHQFIKTYVRPDIIIHQRGNNNRNILWVEMKINTFDPVCNYDIEKAWYATSQLQYQLGISIWININKKSIIFYWVILDKMEKVEFVIKEKKLQEKSRKTFLYEDFNNEAY